MDQVEYEMNPEEKRLFDTFKNHVLKRVEFNESWGEVGFIFEDLEDMVIISSDGTTANVSYGTEDEY